MENNNNNKVKIAVNEEKINQMSARISRIEEAVYNHIPTSIKELKDNINSSKIKLYVGIIAMLVGIVMNLLMSYFK